MILALPACAGVALPLVFTSRAILSLHNISLMRAGLLLGRFLLCSMLFIFYD